MVLESWVFQKPLTKSKTCCKIIRMLAHIKQTVILLALSPLVIGGLVLSIPGYLFHAVVNPARGWKTALAVDDLGNVIANGHLGQTISSRAAHATAAGKTWGKIVCSALDAVNPGHCKKALTAHDQNLNVEDKP